MMATRARLQSAALATVLSVGVFAYGQQPADNTKEPDEPVRPNLSEMTPEQAASAMMGYHQAVQVWEQKVEPIREQAIKAAGAERDARVRLISDPKWKRPVETPKVQVGPDYNWESDAAKQGLDAATLSLLRRDGLAIAGPAFKQSFAVYNDETITPFVTSDSLLNGFHVLLEASLRKFEIRRAAQLREVLETIWQNLALRLAEEKVSRDAVASYEKHLARVIGPSLRLLGSTLPLGDKEVEADVESAVRKIVAAQTVELPDWMAPEDPALLAIDFRRCKPTGFYSDSAVLSDYYRAVRWLQLVPLRAARDNEVGAAALMAEVETRTSSGLYDFVKKGAELWGPEDGPTVCKLSTNRSEFLATIAKVGKTTRAIEQVRSQMVDLGSRNRSLVNDRLRVQGKQGEEAAVLVLGPSVLPDSVFLEELTPKRPVTDSWPQGLEVAAWLGSDFALRSLTQKSGAGLAEAIKVQRNERAEHSSGDRVPDLYYKVLQSLFEPADPVAPAFMSSEAWQRKSGQTALAGWAQLRHAWELQTKLIFAAPSGFTRPAGLVEPNPSFYRRMGQLESSVVSKLQAAGVFTDTTVDQIEFLKGALRTLDRLGAGKIELDLGGIYSEDQNLVYDIVWIARQSNPAIDQMRWQELHGEENALYWRQISKVIQDRIERMERHEHIPPFDSLTYKRDPDQELFRRWQSLQAITAQLEVMVQKQLRGADWTEEEGGLLKNYAFELGAIMGYKAIAALAPKDDAPRWTTVFHDPNNNRDLAIGIGRARALYVLYPWKGKSILCKGAVMTYYEYRSEKRLTDAEWEELLDSPAAPAQTEWIDQLSTPVPLKK